MARVATSDNFAVAPTGAGGTLVRAPSTEGFGAPGQQMQQLGGALQQAGGVANDIILREQQEANQLRVIEAENKAREAALRLAYDPEDGFTNVKGGAVLDRPSGKPLADEYNERFGSTLDEIGAGLVNEAQRKAFAQRAAEMRGSFGAQAMRHEAVEYRGYQLSVVKGAAELSGQAIALNFNDTDAIDRELETLGASVVEIGRINGASGNETTNLKNVAASAALAQAIGAAFDSEQFETANALFERYGDQLVQADRTRIEGPLRRETQGQAVMSAVDLAMSGARNFETGAGTGEVTFAHPLDGSGVTVRGGEYGASRGAKQHNGVDLAVPSGTAVKAPADGTIIAAWNDTEHGGGMSMRVRFDDGSIGGFAHLSGFEGRAGQRVRQGDKIARTGNTGRSTGPHLHYTLERDGQKVNPLAVTPGRRGGAKPATMEDAWSIVRSNLPENAPTAMVKEARAELAFRWGLRADAEREREDAALSSAYEGLLANGGNYRALPAGVRRAVPAEQHDNLMAFARSIGRGERDPVKDDALYLVALSNPEGLRAASDADFFRAYGGHPQFGGIAKYRQELRTGKVDTKAESIDHTTIGRIVGARLTSIGVNPSPDKKGGDYESAAAQVGAVRRHVNREIAAEQARRGKQLTNVETEQFIDGLFMRSETMRDWGLLGIPTGARQVPRLGVGAKQLNKSTRAQIEDTLRTRGVPITDENVLTLYYAMGR